MRFDGRPTEAAFFFQIVEKKCLPSSYLVRLCRPVRLVAPLDELQAWRERLHKLSQLQELDQVDEYVKNVTIALQSLARKNAPWCRAVALVTATAFTRATGQDLSDATKAYGVESKPFDVTRQSLEEAYIDAKQNPAGPLAFYWLTLAAMEVPGLIDVPQAPISPVIRAYLDVLNRPATATAGSLAVDPNANDPVLEYLARRSFTVSKAGTNDRGAINASLISRIQLFLGGNSDSWSVAAIWRATAILASTIFILSAILIWRYANSNNTATDEAIGSVIKNMDKKIGDFAEPNP